MMVTVSKQWEEAYPGAAAGFLALRGGSNPAQHPELEARKAALEDSLRRQYAGFDRSAFNALPVLQAYEDYYRRFKKSYHVGLQIESLVLRGRPIPSVAALVEAMFMAELKNLLLTAGHDLAALQFPVRLDVAQGHELYTVLRGEEQGLKAGDMYIADGAGVLSSIIYGPDQRTQIRPETTEVLFTVYAPPGVTAGQVQAHLEDLRDNVLVFSPQAQLALMQVYSAPPLV